MWLGGFNCLFTVWKHSHCHLNCKEMKNWKPSLALKCIQMKVVRAEGLLKALFCPTSFVAKKGWDQHPVDSGSVLRHTTASCLSVCRPFWCAGLLRVTQAGTGVQLLTTQELRDKAWRCRLLWKVRSLCGGNMGEQIEQSEAPGAFLLFSLQNSTFLSLIKIEVCLREKKWLLWKGMTSDFNHSTSFVRVHLLGLKFFVIWSTGLFSFLVWQ